MERKLLVDFMDDAWDNKDWCDVIDYVAKTCKIHETTCNNTVIFMKVEEDFGFNRLKDAHKPKLNTYYDVTQDLYDYLNEATEGYDCKNGCQLYQNEDGTIYFCISGANFYDKEGNYAGTNEVRIYFKEINLEWQ